MNPAGWVVRHLDVAAGPLSVEADGHPAYVVFWWGALPLGGRAFLPGELPLRPAQVLSITAQYAPRQIAARSPEFGGWVTPGTNGLPIVGYSAQAIVADDPLGLLDAYARPSERPADELSLIVCTRDRPAMLAGCLESIRALRRPPGEVIVVDNSGGRSAEGVCRGASDVTYLHEPRPGLSIARNAGLRAATRPFVAFTDDDVELHPNWTSEILEPFALPGVEAVTGLVLPARLDTPAKAFFQFEMGGLGVQYVPITFDRSFFEACLPRGVPVWQVGAGANMAFRRSVFERVGLFDERLGAGAAGCSEDSELWYRILADGGVCRYEPKAIVFHDHRATWSDLRQQMRAYTRGHVAALFAQYDRTGHSGNVRRVFVQLPAYFARVGLGAAKAGAPRRLQILGEQVTGWLAGLSYGLRPRWRRKRRLPTL